MEAAMAETQGQYDFRVTWQPYLLRPGIPPDGFPKPPGNRVSAHLKSAGESCGIDFTGKADKYPNTVKAHVLMELAKSDFTLQNKLAEALFQAYFTDGSVLSDEDLLGIASSVGMSTEEVLAAFQDQNRLEHVINAAASWSSKGVSGVPMFYMNDQRTFSGAQEPDTFKHMFGLVAERFPLQLPAEKL